MNRKLIILLLFLSLALTNLCAQTTDGQLETVLTDLQKRMSSVRTIQTDFIQEKNLAIFKQKIVLKGSIFIQKPGMLSWKVSTPMRYALVIKDGNISQWDQDSNQIQSVSLSNNPSFQVAIQQMQNWFTGSYKSMEGDYNIKLLGQQPVELEFIPKEGTIPANFIQRVTVLFEIDRQYIKQMNILEKTGDSTLLQFLSPKLNQNIPAQAWEVKINND